MSSEHPAKVPPRGRLFILSGASGTGKTTLCRKLEKELGVYFSVSATTRAARTGEVEGVDYFFLSPEIFQEKIQHHAFLEWARVHGNFYGTPVQPVEEALSAGRDVLLDLDTQGAFHVKKLNPEAVLIFLKAPTLTDLQKRLEVRGTDSPEEIQRRIEQAEEEIKQSVYYDYVVVNRDLGQAETELRAILTSSRGQH